MTRQRPTRRDRLAQTSAAYVSLITRPISARFRRALLAEPDPDIRANLAAVAADVARILDRRYPTFDRHQFLADCGL